MTPWYVWLVWRYAPEVRYGEKGEVRIVGIFSSRQKALDSATPGMDALTLLTLDEAVIGAPELPTEWVK